jgi:predicted O-methyltransferase YrrM
LNRARILPGINLNIEEQLKLVESFKYKHELQHFPLKEEQKLQFFHNNGSFMGADAEFLYSMIRKFKPSRVIEIGCGFSTLMMQAAIRHNKGLDDSYSCRHICIEPYEFDWLEKLDIEIIRKKVEDLPIDFFKLLEENDILFIDSSHIIRPQGDVLFEYLQVLPIINKGVLVHIHDIFTPNDYLEPWIYQLNRFWNEQYLLEAFLSMNPHFHILAAVNYLHHNHKELLSQKDCNKEPCSFWLQRV